MPEGLEKELQPQDIADIIAFIRADVPAPQRKTLEGNKPELVTPLGDGTIRLYPTNCEIFGVDIVMEKQYGNLGFWTSEEDHAVWTVEIPKAGRYHVRLTWACANDSAGNGFAIQAGPARINGNVQGTGTWDDYKTTTIGDINLPAGKHTVVFRSAVKIKGALIDLKELRLAPISQK